MAKFKVKIGDKQYMITAKDIETAKKVIKDKLIQSNSEEAFGKNIATEIKAGKEPDQAAAIAYSVQKENDAAIYKWVLRSLVNPNLYLDEDKVAVYNVERAKQFITRSDAEKWAQSLFGDGWKNPNTATYEVVNAKVSDCGINKQNDISYLTDDLPIKLTSAPGSDRIVYVYQSDLDGNLYFYVGQKYAMKEGNWSYAKYDLNGIAPERLAADLERNGWHKVSKGPASIIDKLNIKDVNGLYTISFIANDVTQMNLIRATSEQDARDKFIRYMQKKGRKVDNIYSVRPAQNYDLKPGIPVIDKKPVHKD